MDKSWKIFLLMDHREFLNSKSNFAPRAKQKIDVHFSTKYKHPLDTINPEYCERCTLISGDYMFVARKFDESGKVIDERVLDLVIERKSVDDLQGCLIKKSKTCAPLSFFEAQMYKLQHTPSTNRIFLMEGDEDKPGESGISQVGNPGEWFQRRKRVKTMRNQIRGDEWQGVKLVCTVDKNHSIQYLVDRMAELMKEGFDPTKLHLYRTMEEHKQFVDQQMKDSTFLEYLRLRKIPGTGDVKAMKAIKDENGRWDKDFISPACSARDKKYKSNLEDRAEYYVSNNIGGMSKKGNTMLPSSASCDATSRVDRRNEATSSSPKERSQSAAPSKIAMTASFSATKGSKAQTTESLSIPDCRKCLQEHQTGRKSNLRHSANCPIKNRTKRLTCNGSGDGNQYKKKTKPTELIYVNENPARRTSLLGGDVDTDLILSIHSARRDLTGGSGLGVGGFEVSSARVMPTSAAKSHGTGRVITQRSNSDISCYDEPSLHASTCKPDECDDVIELDNGKIAISKANKVASLAVGAAAQASHAANEVIVLNDSDDDDPHDTKIPAAHRHQSPEVEVIEID